MKKMKCIKNFYVMDEKEWYEIGDVFDIYTIDEVKGLEYSEQFNAKNSSGMDDDTVGYLKELDGEFLPVWRKDAEELVVEPKDVRRFDVRVDVAGYITPEDYMFETFKEMNNTELEDTCKKLEGMFVNYITGALQDELDVLEVKAEIIAR